MQQTSALFSCGFYKRAIQFNIERGNIAFLWTVKSGKENSTRNILMWPEPPGCPVIPFSFLRKKGTSQSCSFMLSCDLSVFLNQDKRKEKKQQKHWNTFKTLLSPKTSKQVRTGIPVDENSKKPSFLFHDLCPTKDNYSQVFPKRSGLWDVLLYFYLLME